MLAPRWARFVEWPSVGDAIWFGKMFGMTSWIPYDCRFSPAFFYPEWWEWVTKRRESVESRNPRAHFNRPD